MAVTDGVGACYYTVQAKLELYDICYVQAVEIATATNKEFG